MSGYLWFDIFAYVGMACATSAVVAAVYMFAYERRVRRRESREIREFNRQIESLTRIWKRNSDG